MPRLEHVQLCHPDDRARFARHGIAASVQPIHLREDAPGARRDWGDRAESAGYTWRSLLEAGATLAFGQDAPLEPLDPWPGIAMSVLRRDPTWPTDMADFGPHEALTLEQALRASTVGVAATVKDALGGRLVPGSPADLIVLPAAPTEDRLRAAAYDDLRPRLSCWAAASRSNAEREASPALALRRAGTCRAVQAGADDSRRSADEFGAETDVLSVAGRRGAACRAHLVAEPIGDRGPTCPHRGEVEGPEPVDGGRVRRAWACVTVLRRDLCRAVGGDLHDVEEPGEATRAGDDHVLGRCASARCVGGGG